MKIIVWNVGRPGKSKTTAINQCLTSAPADIVVLTETNVDIKPEGEYFSVSSLPLQKVTEGIIYKPHELRVSVYSKYPLVNQGATFNGRTAVCLNAQTPYGELLMYATIIGILGGTNANYHTELLHHLSDFNKYFNQKAVCLIGDLNTTFTGRVYPSIKARGILNNTFDKYNLVNLTHAVENCVDHIVVSKDFISNRKFTISTWNEDKRLSDHIGIMVDISF